jgi:hypothetical protein
MAAILKSDDNLSLASSVSLNQESNEKLLNELFSLMINMLTNNDSSERRHVGVKCSICERINFNLDRYRCIICKDYDHCGKCFEDKRVNLLINSNLIAVNNKDYTYSRINDNTQDILDWCLISNSIFDKFN